MNARWPLAVLTGALFVAAPAAAWPVDVLVDVEAGGVKFHRLTAVSWVEVEDPKVATAEVMPSGELLVSGKEPGRTLVLLYAEGKFAVWRVRVGPKGGRPPVVAPDAALGAARKACPTLKLSTASADAALTATVADEPCRQALHALLSTDGFLAGELQLTFELVALQSQLSAMQAGVRSALGRDLALKYVGAGLVVGGSLTPQEHRRALWEIFRAAVGRVPLDDQVALQAPSAPAPEADAGTSLLDKP